VHLIAKTGNVVWLMNPDTAAVLSKYEQPYLVDGRREILHKVLPWTDDKLVLLIDSMDEWGSKHKSVRSRIEVLSMDGVLKKESERVFDGRAVGTGVLVGNRVLAGAQSIDLVTGRNVVGDMSSWRSPDYSVSEGPTRNGVMYFSSTMTTKATGNRRLLVAWTLGTTRLRVLLDEPAIGSNGDMQRK
jgi:hypothetical protein